jgi:hypothetical protein
MGVTDTGHCGQDSDLNAENKGIWVIDKSEKQTITNMLE